MSKNKNGDTLGRRLSGLYAKDGTKSLLASLISILIGLLFGAILVTIVGLVYKMGAKNIWEGVQLVFMGIFTLDERSGGALAFGFNPVSIGNMLFRATPLILTGLSVGVAYKTGLFNIGAPGQYLMGTAATLVIALSIPAGALPAPLIWLLAFLGGILAGAVWGCLPGIAKAFLNINEVLACIMTNWIAGNIVAAIFDGSKFCNMVETTKTSYIYKTTYGLTQVAAGTGIGGGDYTYVDGAGVATAKLGLDKLFPGSQVNGGILIAIVIAIGIYILMSKTTLGYRLKACGANRHAARYAGINDKGSIVLSMAIAGALSGAAAALYWLSGNTEYYWSSAYQTLPAIGFNGIPVALLASCNPIGIIFSGTFMSMLNITGQTLFKHIPTYNEYISDVIIAAIVYLSAFSLLIKTLLGSRKKKRAKGGGGDEPVLVSAPAQTTADPPDTPPAEDTPEQEGGEEQ